MLVKFSLDNNRELIKSLRANFPALHTPVLRGAKNNILVLFSKPSRWAVVVVATRHYVRMDRTNQISIDRSVIWQGRDPTIGFNGSVGLFLRSGEKSFWVYSVLQCHIKLVFGKISSFDARGPSDLTFQLY